MQALDPAHVDLAGIHLIEASAGTGKTYTIASLYLRMLIEKSLGVEQILVVTYTVPATDELRSRIRTGIKLARDAFLGCASDDLFLKQYVQNTDENTTKQAVKRLTHALQRFDQAAIFTIHGFCQRMLQEMAFESSSLFDAELIIDQSDILQEFADDFFRSNFYGKDLAAEFVDYALNNGCAPGAFAGLLRKASLDVILVPEQTMPQYAVELANFRETFGVVEATWVHAKNEIETILLNYEGLNRNKYRRTSILQWIDQMQGFIDSGRPSVSLFKYFNKFATSGLQEGTTKDAKPPVHEFFDACENFMQAARALEQKMRLHVLHLKNELFTQARREFPRKKESAGVFHFDDLLLKMRDALISEKGTILAQAVKEKYRAALIDEFQDTDPVQYTIFQKIFADGPLFLIGDPKQAIYSFRGADIFTYMDASSRVAERNKHTLRTNWRSEDGLVQAINTLFKRTYPAFVFNGISYEGVRSADRGDIQVFAGDAKCPLNLWFLPLEGQDILTRSRAEDKIVRAVVLEILDLLYGGLERKICIGDQPVTPRDIAVLVREHFQARAVRDELCAHTVPCVLYSDETVFDSTEALEMEIVLRSILEPEHEGYVRSALATTLMGYTAEKIECLSRDESGWEELLLRFRDYHALWIKAGFMTMFRNFLSLNNVRARLLGMRRGERRLTNILHLAELINGVSIEKKLGMRQSVTWLSRQRNPDIPRSDEHQLRLESDEDAVKILTIHKSKGLEYPIVFCPFTWRKSELGRRDTSNFIFHDEAKGGAATLELGSDEIDEHKSLAEREILAENMRLLYVALTRARHRVYLAWGKIKDADTSAPAYLFHFDHASDGNTEIEMLSKMNPDDETMLTDLNDLVRKDPAGICVCDLPHGLPGSYKPSVKIETDLVARTFNGQIDRSWSVASYTALVSGKPVIHDVADYDAPVLVTPQAQPVPAKKHDDIFSFPRGAGPGIALHAIMETLDFASGESERRKCVADTLAHYEFDGRWIEPVLQMVNRVLALPLITERADFSFSKLTSKQRINEMEFYFPLKLISKQDLIRIFSGFDLEIPPEFPTMIDRLVFQPTRGFMRGFIDMIFCFENRYYLVDWKSNYLGDSVDDYHQGLLKNVVLREFYILQYHLYSLALNRYLSRRIAGYSYREHFGGVYYMFLRGIDPIKGVDYGVYRIRPSAELIEALDNVLIEG
ncbi:MAG: exodeoxyribonuclease V subunit beta [Deltaproteobacteria bacterium]|nr:exodeoxyribonuclease V subunit beta [Deltaproteobacteria bacterium]